jgi:hypothetical protein
MNTNTAPRISRISVVAGGALTSGATYRYRCVAERLDGSRGPASDVVSIKPSRGALTASLAIALPAGPMPRALHVYRTRANGSTFLRAVSIEFGREARGVTVDDGLADAHLTESLEEPLTEGAISA